MDLGQQSNLGSLVSAVLVGLLALASNQYLRMDHSAMKSFLNNLQSPNRAAVERVDPIELSVKKITSKIERLETQLSEVFEKWKRGSITADDQRLSKFWKAIHELQAECNADDDLRESLPARAQVDLVWILFRAAEMNPGEFSEPFLSRSSELAGQNDETVSAQAAVLRIYHGFDHDRPDEAYLSERLESFARENPDNMVGIFLYLIICRDLYETGHREMAERILRRGIQVYSGFPGNVGRLKLINELMDQQMAQ